MDALELLRSQHAAIVRGLEAACSEEEPERQLQQLAHLLLGHMVIEEHLFYPRVAEVANDEQMLAEAYEQHMIARFALGRAMVGGAEARARLSVLKDLVLHHIQEEEQELFPRAKKLLSRAELMELGETMRVEFERVLTSDFDDVLESDGSLRLQAEPPPRRSPPPPDPSPRRRPTGPMRRSAAR